MPSKTRHSSSFRVRLPLPEYRSTDSHQRHYTGLCREMTSVWTSTTLITCSQQTLQQLTISICSENAREWRKKMRNAEENMRKKPKKENSRESLNRKRRRYPPSLRLHQHLLRSQELPHPLPDSSTSRTPHSKPSNYPSPTATSSNAMAPTTRKPNTTTKSSPSSTSTPPSSSLHKTKAASFRTPPLYLLLFYVDLATDI